VFGTYGVPSRCLCQRFKTRGRHWDSEEASPPVEQRAARLREQTRCGHPEANTTSGLVAYIDGESVGWCAVEPRSAYVRIGRVPWAGRAEDKTDESVSPRRASSPARDAGRLPDMSTAREGGCACGAVRYRLTSDPLFVHCCHCLNCQRQTGSAFVINVLIEADRVELLSGEPLPVDVPRDKGEPQRIWRCPICQVAVFSQYTSPLVRFVRAGTLDDPASVAPDVHIFTRSKQPWVTLPESVPAFEAYYDMNELWPAASLERLEALRAAATADG